MTSTHNTHELDKEEPLLIQDNFRYTTYPIEDGEIWQLYEIHKAGFWTAQEIKFENDANEFNDLTKDEQHFIKNILAFFASSDVIVNINLTSRFLNEVKSFEALVFYKFQAMMEDIHSETYSMLIDIFVKDPTEKNKLFNALDEMPCVQSKAAWAYKWIDSDARFAQRLIAFAIVEGIFFSGSFCAIYWIKEKNILDGLTKSNEFIARDEGLHTDFACLMYSRIKNKLDNNIVLEMIKEAVDIESEFITDSIPCKLVGMNSELMIVYIKHVANRLYNKLGYVGSVWENVSNPFSFMEKISLEKKTNFFDKRPSTYQNAYVQNKGTNLNIIEDF
jgi:ribonucleotide reductase beta subunit family protein with ferritin-like domain